VIDSRFASRKFILAAAMLAAGIALLVLGFVDAEQWVSFSTWILGLYVTGNVGTYLVAGTSKVMAEKAQTEAYKAQIAAELARADAAASAMSAIRTGSGPPSPGTETL
jgi:hypothetical protein